MTWKSGPQTPPTMPWGKHRGLPFDEIPTDYLVWVLCEAEAARPGLKALVRAELLQRGVEVEEEAEGSRQAPPSPPPPRNGISALDALTRWYRTACRKYHPDRGGSEQAMRVVNEAYEELKKLLGGG